MCIPSDHVKPSSGLVGVGYQGASLDDFVRRLVNANIATLVDVRLNAISRRKGFSKTLLASTVRAAGIEYRHLRVLGNPPANRAGFSDNTGAAGRLARQRYGDLLTQPEAVEALCTLSTLGQGQRVAVMCFESDETSCHRSIVLQRVAEIAGLSGQNRGSAAASKALG